MPDRAGTILSVLAEKLDFDGPEYEQFYRWVFSPKSILNARFAASVFVFERGNGGRYPLMGVEEPPLLLAAHAE